MDQITYLLKNSIQKFIKDNAAEKAAALSFYTLFAIPSIFLISLNLINTFLADLGAREILLAEITGLAGQPVADIFANLILHLDKYSNQASFAQWIGIFALIIAAGGALGQIHHSLNSIWNLTEHPSRNLFTKIKNRLAAMLTVGIIEIFVLISVILNTYLGILQFEKSPINNLTSDLTQLIINLIFYFGMVLLTALIFKTVPDGKIAWKDSIVGAFFTSVLFVIGRYIIVLVLKGSAFNSIYGAAGSLLVLLIWVYYLSNIFFFGAEFTKVYANKFGKGILPDLGVVKK